MEVCRNKEEILLYLEKEDWDDINVGQGKKEVSFFFFFLNCYVLCTARQLE